MIEIKPLSEGSASDEKFKVPDPLPKTAFMALVSGERGSGKSVFIQNILQIYRKSMDYIFIMCASLDLNDDYEFLKEDKFFGSDNHVQTVFKEGNINKFPSLINNLINKQKQLIKQYGRADSPNVLLVLDDILEQPNKLVDRRSGIIEKLSYNGRHLKISCILATQLFRAVSNGIRSNCDLVVVYSATNLMEIQKYLEEFSLKRDRKVIEEILSHVFDIPYTFVTMVGKLTANRLGLKRQERLLYKLDYPLIQHKTKSKIENVVKNDVENDDTAKV